MLEPPSPSALEREGAPRGCCGCILFPSVLVLFGSAVFWFTGFTAGLVLHGLAAGVWAVTHAVGHALFGWPLPAIGSKEKARRRLEE